MTTMNTFPAGGTHRCEGLVYHGSRCMTCFRLFEFDSGFSGSDDVDEVVIDGVRECF